MNNQRLLEQPRTLSPLELVTHAFRRQRLENDQIQRSLEPVMHASSLEPVQDSSSLEVRS